MGYRLSTSSKKHRVGIDPRLIEISDLAITLTLVDFGHGKYAGLRTAIIQHDLFNRGKSNADGYIIIGKHQTGRALDFYAFVDGKASWEPEHLAMVACAFFSAASILGYRIKWGGLWKSRKPVIKNGIPYGWDMPHIELLDD
jgi:peptidoglycan L-alanyl-D-glutamate endopeptidase CwlK